MCPACEIPWKATVRFETVPTNAADLAAMEVQLRHAYAIPVIYENVAYGTQGKAVCATFAKAKLTPADLDMLNDVGRALFAPYPTASP